ncbi:MAG: Gfo/Idh/MocA family oxidoreductase, partial [Maribacter sp.]
MTKIKFAVAGLGRIGKIHLDNLLQMQGIEVIAATDPIAKSLNYAKEKGVPHTPATYQEMLAIPEIDAVLICSPTDTHADYVELAAKAGIHIFCEKPLDLSIKRVVDV